MVTGILILIGSLRCLKEETNGQILVKCIFQNLSNICCWYTLELPHRGKAIPMFWLVGFVALRPKSTAMVIAGRSVHLTTLFPGQA